EWGGVKAINVETGNIDWEYKFYIGSLSAGVLATDGGVLFAASRDGNLVALDKRNGKLLWRFQTGAAIDSSPMSYAVDGTQFVALSAGSVLYSFALGPISIPSRHQAPGAAKVRGWNCGYKSLVRRRKSMLP